MKVIDARKSKNKKLQFTKRMNLDADTFLYKTIGDTIDYLNKILLENPSISRDAKLDFDRGDSWHDVSLDLVWVELESDEDYEKRIKKEERIKELQDEIERLRNDT